MLRKSPANGPRLSEPQQVQSEISVISRQKCNSVLDPLRLGEPRAVTFSTAPRKLKGVRAPTPRHSDTPTQNRASALGKAAGRTLSIPCAGCDRRRIALAKDRGRALGFLV